VLPRWIVPRWRPHQHHEIADKNTPADEAAGATPARRLPGWRALAETILIEMLPRREP
jgi:hypothetical protein